MLITFLSRKVHRMCYQKTCPILIHGDQKVPKIMDFFDDMDGDGIVNGYDPDMDGDGTMNELDYDMENDGYYEGNLSNFCSKNSFL